LARVAARRSSLALLAALASQADAGFALRSRFARRPRNARHCVQGAHLGQTSLRNGEAYADSIGERLRFV
jgi:hypothetical protein